MKAVILAGGTGSRLRPITHTIQKQTLPVGPTPILIRAVRRCREAGLTEIAVVLGDTGAADVRSQLGDGEQLGVSITYVNQGEPLGLAHAVSCCQSFVDGEPFLVHFGDTVFQKSLKPLVSEFEPTTMDALLGVTPVETPEEHAIVVEQADGTVTEVYEKPVSPPSNKSPVVDIFGPKIFDSIKQITPSWRNELEIMDAIQHLIDSNGQCYAHELEGWWVDAGTPSGYRRANRRVVDQYWSNGDRPQGDSEPTKTASGQIAESASIDADVEVRPPVYIGPEVSIPGQQTVGPYAVIHDGVVIDRCTVVDSVVLSGAKVTGNITLKESIVGQNVSLKGDSGEVSGVIGSDTTFQFG